MLLLTSINDRLQLVTSSVADIDVHASWVDTTGSPTTTITPGRTNTAIALAAITSVAGTPAASTQRNVKTLHVRNKHASLACDVTVQHTDGTVVAELYKVTLGAGDALEYTDQAGFGGGRVPAPPPPPNFPKIVVLTSSGTYTPTANMTHCFIECIGGGGGGGGGTGNYAGTYFGGGGGGSGSYSRKFATAANVGASQPITIGAAGVGGAYSTTAPGTNGGTTSLGSLCIALGGGGGAPGGQTQGGGQGGAGGAPGTGDIIAAGAPGEMGEYRNAPGTIDVGRAGGGGSSYYGGGGVPTSSASSGSPGAAGRNYGSGGSGGSVANAGVGVFGGNGSPGVVVVTEFFY